MQACERALEENPDQAAAWHLKGSLLERLGRFEQAGQAYRRALALDPGHTGARENLGALQERQDDSPTAIGSGWRSGLVFMLGFALAEALGGYLLFSAELPRNAILIANALLQGLAGGLCSLWLGAHLELKSAGRTFAAGFAGFGIGYLLPQLYQPPETLLSSLPTAYLLVALRSGIQLAFAGTLLGLALNGRRLAILLAIFGAISALYEVILSVAAVLFLTSFVLADVSLLDPGAFEQLGWVQGLLVGGLSGFLIGMGYGWFARKNH